MKLPRTKNQIDAVISYSLYKYKAYLLSMLLFLLFNSTMAQMNLQDVEFDKIEQKTVEAYLNRQMEEEKESFTEIKPSLSTNSNTDGFNYHERVYIIKDSINKVWSHYEYTNPVDAWNTGKFNFGFMISKNDEELIYPDQKVEKVETGQLIYLNLKLLKIKNIATAFEIITLDPENRIMEFSYVDDNVTHGKQQLSFKQLPNGHTQIAHRSYFKSKSNWRDRVLYPYFHTRLTNNYHKHMKRLYRDAISLVTN